MAIKRLFIEIDKMNEHNQWELDSSLDIAEDLSNFKGKKFFWKVIDNARFQPDLFELIKQADEIHMSTSIMPIVTYTSLGSPALWNKMMQLAIDENVVGKSVFIQRKKSDVEWKNLDLELLDKAFKKNYLYTADDEYDGWAQVDIDEVIKKVKTKKR